MKERTTNKQLYQSFLGCLHHAVIARHDIAYAVGCVSRFANDPQTSHMIAAKKILRYLKGTPNFGIYFPNSRDTFIITYANVDYGRGLDTRRPISGVVHKMGDAPIKWSSKRQPTVAFSSIEVEYRVLIDAAKDIVYLHKLFNELNIGSQHPTPILNDNQSWVHLQ
jgi:hypothetical protein